MEKKQNYESLRSQIFLFLILLKCFKCIIIKSYNKLLKEM